MPTLPTEILTHIFKEVTRVHDILSLQRVSKQFHDITHDPSFVKSLYMRANLLRPSGPFKWQSPEYLFRKMAQSDSVARAWRKSKRTRLSLHGENPIFRPAPGYWEIVRSRWLFWTSGAVSDDVNELICTDLKTGLQQFVHEECHPFDSSATGSISVNGEMVYLLTIVEVVSGKANGKLDIFRVDEHSDSLTFVESVEVPSEYVPVETPLIYAEGHLVSLCTELEILVFDSQSRLFYSFRDDLPGTEESWPDEYDKLRHPVMPVILAKTHILIYRRWIWGDTGHDRGSLIHGFKLAAATPTEHEKVRQLRLTHREIVPLHSYSGPVCLMFEPFVHPTEGYTRVGFMNCHYDDSDFYFPTHITFVDLLMDPPNLPDTHWFSDENADPERDHLGKIEVKEKLLFKLQTRAHSIFAQSSDNGYIRGICLAGSDTRADEACKFSIDLKGDIDHFPKKSAVRGSPAICRVGFKCRVEDFDGVRGQAVLSRFEEDQYPRVAELWLADVL